MMVNISKLLIREFTSTLQINNEPRKSNKRAVPKSNKYFDKLYIKINK